MRCTGSKQTYVIRRLGPETLKLELKELSGGVGRALRRLPCWVTVELQIRI